MTRYARAKGSKASNERVPENASSWKEIQKGIAPKELPKDNESNLVADVLASTQKRKRDDKKSVEHKRRKPYKETNTMFINGAEIELAYFDGFPIKKSDAEHLKRLKKEMISKGIPRTEINKALKLERRKAEKSLAREKKKVCFNCRISGHTISECPKLEETSNVEQFQTGICFKCGSTEHTHFECKVNRGDNFKFAQCFICKEQGHIARQCPDNNRGIYPRGGACKLCGDVTHLRKDCPKHQEEANSSKTVAYKIDYNKIDALENESTSTSSHSSKKKQKVYLLGQIQINSLFSKLF
ncbi:hypothetical protein FQR65_LT14179 [Abscondita terminalis]|nr:hypothetical protein FQR65_LT14179 [Abscondita terminalis]